MSGEHMIHPGSLPSSSPFILPSRGHASFDSSKPDAAEQLPAAVHGPPAPRPAYDGHGSAKISRSAQVMFDLFWLEFSRSSYLLSDDFIRAFLAPK